MKVSKKIHLQSLFHLEKAVEKCKKGKLKFLQIHYSIESEKGEPTIYTFIGGNRDEAEIYKNLLFIKVAIDKSIETVYIEAMGSSGMNNESNKNLN